MRKVNQMDSKSATVGAPGTYSLRTTVTDQQRDVKSAFIVPPLAMPIVPRIEVTAVQAAPPPYALRATTVAKTLPPPAMKPKVWSRLVPIWNLFDVTQQGKVFKLHIQIEGNTPLVAAASKQTHPTFEQRCVLEVTFSVRQTVKGDPYVFVHGFYSRMQKDLGFAKAVNDFSNPYEKRWFKGLGQSALCYLMDSLLAQKAVFPGSLVVLEASGSKADDPTPAIANPGLIPYYISLGFRYPDPPSRLYSLIGSTGTATRMAKKYEPAHSWQEFFDVAGYAPLFSTVDFLRKVCEISKRHTFS
jgi:hypothetical protein